MILGCKDFRKLRKRAGLTLQELADYSGLSKSMLSLFETGKRDLSPDAHECLYDAFSLAINTALAKARNAANKWEKLSNGTKYKDQFIRDSDPDIMEKLKKRMEQDLAERQRSV